MNILRQNDFFFFYMVYILEIHSSIYKANYWFYIVLLQFWLFYWHWNVNNVNGTLRINSKDPYRVFTYRDSGPQCCCLYLVLAGSYCKSYFSGIRYSLLNFFFHFVYFVNKTVDPFVYGIHIGVSVVLHLSYLLFNFGLPYFCYVLNNVFWRCWFQLIHSLCHTFVHIFHFYG